MAEFVQNNKLVSREDWEKSIEILQKKQPSLSLKEALLSAVKKRIPKYRFGIFLSGGVDSTLLAHLCKKAGADFICYSAGLEGSPDLEWSTRAAQELGLTQKKKTFTLNEAEQLFKKTAQLLHNPDPLSVGVGSVIVAATELAKQDGITTFMGGLGSEEIFAGYERHAKATDINEECWRGLKAMWPRDLTRDTALGQALGISALCPYLDDELIITAMQIDGKEKLNKEHKKIPLRKLAEELCLPKHFCWRKKQAAQYGSKLDYALEKFAKQKKMTKGEYIKSLKTAEILLK